MTQSGHRASLNDAHLNRYAANPDSPGKAVRRREFITLVGGTAATWPLSVRAQQADKIPRVAFLGPGRTTPGQDSHYKAIFSQLEKHGFREGQNIVVEYRAVDDSRGPFVGAAELMRTQPDLTVATGPEVALQAIVGASSHTPVVMLAVNFDPFERGYVASLAQPGGNITGVVVRPIELARKQIDLLKQTFPDRARVAMLYDVQTADQFAAANQAARSLKLQVQAIKLETFLRLRWCISGCGRRQSAVDDGAIEHGFRVAWPATCRTCNQTRPAHHVYFSALRRCRRTNVLWRRISADVAANRGLCRANFKGRETY
jgi:hypothetical protein